MTLADEIFAEFKHAEDQRAIDMPTERDALLVMYRARQRLIDLGWKDAIYSPKDGSVFLAIESACAVPGVCQYLGDWPSGSWWMLDGGDLYPSRPILWKEKP